MFTNLVKWMLLWNMAMVPCLTSGTVLAGKGEQLQPSQDDSQEDPDLIHTYVDFIKNEKTKYADHDLQTMLDLLCVFVEQLPIAARDPHGKHVDLKHIYTDTIFVHSLIKGAVKEKIKDLHIDNPTLAQLYRIAHHFQLRPLVNAFASVIAERLSPTKNLEAQLKDTGFKKIPRDQQKLIRKYLYLKKKKIEECTIADWIGVHGQPEVINNCVYLSHKGITSLEGLELIVNPEEVTEIDLEDNFILGDNLDADFPTKPFARFTALQELSLAGNQLLTVANDTFHDLKRLETLNLSRNKLEKLPRELFKDLRMLKFLSLYDNQLSFLSKNQFVALRKLTTLDLAKNQFTLIPAVLFLNQEELEVLSISLNPLIVKPKIPPSVERELEHYREGFPDYLYRL